MTEPRIRWEPRYWQELRAKILAEAAERCVTCRTSESASDPPPVAVPAEEGD